MPRQKYTHIRVICYLLITGLGLQIVCAHNSGSPLFEGPTYADIHRSINEKHKFVGAYDFQAGAILFEGQWQTQLAIKYDAYQEQLLLRHPRALGAPTTVYAGLIKILNTVCTS